MFGIGLMKRWNEHAIVVDVIVVAVVVDVVMVVEVEVHVKHDWLPETYIDTEVKACMSARR